MRIRGSKAPGGASYASIGPPGHWYTLSIARKPYPAPVARDAGGTSTIIDRGSEGLFMTHKTAHSHDSRASEHPQD